MCGACILGFRSSLRAGPGSSSYHLDLNSGDGVNDGQVEMREGEEVLPVPNWFEGSRDRPLGLVLPGMPTPTA